jgi:hypothetical protein
MDIFGVTVPLWAIFVGGIILVLLAWKLIKFTIKLVFIVVAFLIILIGLDFAGVFDWIHNLLTPVLPV